MEACTTRARGRSFVEIRLRGKVDGCERRAFADQTDRAIALLRGGRLRCFGEDISDCPEFGVRERGRIAAYVPRAELGTRCFADVMRPMLASHFSTAAPDLRTS